MYHLLTEHQDGEEDTYIVRNASCENASIHASICPLMQGDRSYLLHLDLMKTFMNNEPNCHMKNPIGCANAQSKEGFWNYLGAAYELKYSQML